MTSPPSLPVGVPTAETLAAALSGRRMGAGWVALCPAHDDHRPSLSIGAGKGGRVLVHCQAGCPQDKVIAALREKDLWARNGKEPMTKAREIATYDYQSGDGTLLYQVVRYEPKDFRQRKPDGKGGWIWKIEGVRGVLYRLPELATMPRDAPIFITEGEKDVDNLCTHLGLCATCNSGGAGKFTEDLRGPLKGRHVVVIADKDAPGRDHAAKVAHLLHGFAASVKVLELPGDTVKDASDWTSAGGTRAQLEALVDAAPEWTQADPPDLAATLDAVRQYFGRFVVATDAQLDALTLWTAHTYVADASDTFAYVHVTAPEKASGKSRVLEVASALVRKPLLAANVSVAVLARRLDSGATLLLDEMDATFGSNGKSPGETQEVLRGAINAGWRRRGGYYWRMVGVGAAQEERSFKVCGPKMFAGIGDLPGTIADRCIRVAMRRALPSERVSKFRERDAGVGEPLRAHLEGWAATPGALDALRATEPDMPDALSARQMDTWEPLVSIADRAGGDWPQRAREAAIKLSGEATREDQSLGTRLLRDLKSVFDEKKTDRLPSAELVKALNAMEEAPWSDLDRRPLDTTRLARMLRRYGIKPKTLRMGETTSKGYEREVLQDPWERYAPTLPGVLPVTPVTLDTAQIQMASRNTDTGPQANVTGNGQIQARYDVTAVTAKGAGGAGEGGDWEAAL